MKIHSCPVCQTAPSVAPVDEYSLITCSNCHITWTWIGNDIDESVLYQDEVYAVKDNRKSLVERIILFEAWRILKSVEKITGQPDQKSVLDFGCGKGQFLFMARKRGWKTMGVETAKARAAFAVDKYEVTVDTGLYFNGLVRNGNYNLITLLHVLEHLPQPISLMEELTKSNLKAEGLVVLEIPNIRSWQARIAGKKWMHLDIPKHVTHWDEKLLIKEMDKIGFKPVKRQYLSVHLGVLGMLDAILVQLGYKGNIIIDLKNGKPKLLFVAIAIILPPAFLLEAVSGIFRKSGIFRGYFRKN